MVLDSTNMLFKIFAIMLQTTTLTSIFDKICSRLTNIMFSVAEWFIKRNNKARRWNSGYVEAFDHKQQLLDDLRYTTCYHSVVEHKSN